MSNQLFICSCLLHVCSITFIRLSFGSSLSESTLFHFPRTHYTNSSAFLYILHYPNYLSLVYNLLTYICHTLSCSYSLCLDHPDPLNPLILQTILVPVLFVGLMVRCTARVSPVGIALSHTKSRLFPIQLRLDVCLLLLNF